MEHSLRLLDQLIECVDGGLMVGTVFCHNNSHLAVVITLLLWRLPHIQLQPSCSSHGSSMKIMLTTSPRLALIAAVGNWSYIALAIETSSRGQETQGSLSSFGRQSFVKKQKRLNV